MFVGLAAAWLGVVGCHKAPPPTTRAVQPTTTQAAELLPVHFINVDCTGNRIVFMCDVDVDSRAVFDILCVKPLQKSIEGLQPSQSFNVVFLGSEVAVPLLDKKLLPASAANKQRLCDYCEKYTPLGPADVRPGIEAAFAMHPDVIFFLCDPSDFPDPKAIEELFRTLNADHKCKVNTISFMDEDHQGEDLLKKISADSGGKFKYVSKVDVEK